MAQRARKDPSRGGTLKVDEISAFLARLKQSFLEEREKSNAFVSSKGNLIGILSTETISNGRWSESESS